jgi:branched-chain amino acid transport system substrate-binding protein
MAGRKVEVTVEDAEGKPDVGLTKAKKLVERDNVHLLAGIIHSGVAQAVAVYAKTQKKILFINSAGSDVLTQQQFSPYIFRNSMTNSLQSHPLGEWAYKKGYRKVSIMAADYAAGYEFAGGFARTFIQAGGAVVQEQYPPLQAPDLAPFVTAINPNADVVYAFIAGAEALRFVPTYNRYGIKKRTALVGNGPVDDWLLPQLEDDALGIVTSCHYTISLNTPASKAFLAAFRKKYNRNPTFYAERGYLAGMMLKKALEEIKGNVEDTDALIKALEKVEIPDAPRGPVRFDKYHMAVYNVYVTEVKKSGDNFFNEIIETYKDVSQFWKWSPEEYLKMPRYVSMKGKWAK